MGQFLHSFRMLLLCILLTGLLFSLPPFHSACTSTAAPPQIKVGITLPDSFLQLSFDSGYRLVDRSSGSFVGIPAGEYSFFVSGNGMEIQDQLGKSYGTFGASLYLESLTSPVDSVFEILNACYGKEYRGELEIVFDGSGQKINAVNIIDLETYLRGIVAREIPPSWGNYGGMEALKAQAVAARTYALYQQGLQRHSGYHLCDTRHCQVYGGKGTESSNTDLAIAETRGEILTYDGKAIEPVYHATNGGYTEEAQNVWSNPVSYFRSEPDPYDDPDNPLEIGNMVIHTYATWEADIPCEKVADHLVSGGYTDPGVVERIIIASSFPSRRVNELVIQGSGDRIVSLFKEKIRTVLGLNSQLFTVREEPEPRVWIASSVNGTERKEKYSELEGKWVIGRTGTKRMLLGEIFPVLGSEGNSTVPYLSFIFEGQGLGHGIGMSQNGAYNRSREGQNYRDILSFYYPGTEITSGY